MPDPDRHAPKGVQTTWRKFIADAIAMFESAPAFSGAGP